MMLRVREMLVVSRLLDQTDTDVPRVNTVHRPLTITEDDEVLKTPTHDSAGVSTPSQMPKLIKSMTEEQIRQC